MPQTVIDNRRIAKNTILLYVRTLFVLIISLYTSRVILDVLGVEGYGTYQVVGGMVAMFSVLSSSLSSAISRFITFEIGRGNNQRLAQIFASSMVIQIGLAVLIFILAEIIGIWFLEAKAQIPEENMTAARWVLHCTLATFCINLISVPYNACIIAHEHMKAFAYVSVLDAVLKLAICYLVVISPIDRLISYAVLMALIALGIRILYTVYCHRHFEESRTRLTFDRQIFREMFGFAGWSFFNNTVSIFNSQGVNMLINVFFGVTLNAARGIANTVESGVLSFVNNFTVAVNPQITKSYAAGDLKGMHLLVCRGSKFSFFLMLLMSLPFICEADTVLHLWLKEVPPLATLLVQLSLVLGLLDSIGFAGYTACIATGRLRSYSLIISSIGVLEFPLSWIAFSMGGAIEVCYYIYIVIKVAVLIARMYLLQSMVGLPVGMFAREVFLPVVLVTILAVVPSIVIVCTMPASPWRFALSVIVGIGTPSLVALYVGMKSYERQMILKKAQTVLQKITQHQ